MKYKIFFVFLLSLEFCQAQDSLSVETYSSALSLGEDLEAGNITVKFKGLISDSRCPKGVTCIWAGEAKVLVEIYKGEKFCRKEILTINGGNLSATLNDIIPGELFSLSVSSLHPYPEASGKINPSDYVLHLEVKERSGSLFH